MKDTTMTHRHGFAMLLLVVCAFLGLPARSQQGAPPIGDRKVPPPRAYAGDAACAECHQKEAKAYATTPHALDSGPPNAKDILGSFTSPANVLHTADPDLTFVMTKTPAGFYQSAARKSEPNRTERKRMDVVIGSGRHGQTYLYWQGDQLYELPVSYWTYLHRWVNSPGYLDGVVQWYRPAIPRCLECHSSYFTSIAPPNRYVRSSLVLGIGCERCHGPGATHVARERSKTPPLRRSAEEAIVNPAHLSRDKQLSLCSLCHAGVAESIGPAMTYVVGDNIDDFLDILPPPPDAPVDVHGNQVGAMKQSKCFRSGKLTCSTCHNVHETQENAEAFSGHCLECHTVASCGKYRAMGNSIRGKCVDCHMPLGKSHSITSANAGQDLQATMRTHRIAIYPDATISDASVQNEQKGH